MRQGRWRPAEDLPKRFGTAWVVLNEQAVLSRRYLAMHICLNGRSFSPLYCERGARPSPKSSEQDVSVTACGGEALVCLLGADEEGATSTRAF